MSLSDMLRNDCKESKLYPCDKDGKAYAGKREPVKPNKKEVTNMHSKLKDIIKDELCKIARELDIERASQAGHQESLDLSNSIIKRLEEEQEVLRLELKRGKET